MIILFSCIYVSSYSILRFSCFLTLLIISVQLLQKLNITAVGKREKLLRVIKNPVTQYLPLNSRKIGKQSLLEVLIWWDGIKPKW